MISPLVYFRFALLFSLALVAHADDPLRQDVDVARLTIAYHDSNLRIFGDISSVANEAILRNLAERLFDGAEFEFAQRLQTPPGWALLGEMTLRAVAATESATAVIDSDQLVIEGVTNDIAEFDRLLVGVRRALLPQMTLDNRVAISRRSASLQEQCERVFSTALATRRVNFKTSGAEPTTASYPLLDQLVEIAADCAPARIIVTGHTDGTGDELANALLSTARAQAVVAYMMRRGISADRLSATGAGGSHPVADNDSAHGRRQNRRIEFELVFE